MPFEKINIILMANPDIAIPCLEFIKNHSKLNLTQVITAKAKPFGRKKELKDPDIAQYAKNHQIKLLQTDNINKEKDWIEESKSLNPFLILVFAYGQFLKEEILELPQLGIFNIHTSLLPELRGAAPIQHALLHGKKITGISIQKMVKKMDAGDIFYDEEIPIYPYEKHEDLYLKLKYMAPLVFARFLDGLLTDTLKIKKQNEQIICN